MAKSTKNVGKETGIVKRVETNEVLANGYSESQDVYRDLADIKIADFEEQTELEIKKIEGEIKAKQEQVSVLEKKSVSLVEKTDYSCFAKKVSDLVDSLKTSTFYPHAKAEYSTPALGNSDDNTGKKIVVNAVISLTKKADDYYNRNEKLNLSDTFPVPSEYCEIRKEIQTINTDIMKLNENKAKLKVNLSKISTVERRVKATIARNRLAKTEQGKELLESVKNVKALPGLE